MKAASNYLGGQIAILLLFSLSALFWAPVIWLSYSMEHPLVRLMMPVQSSWTGQQVFFVWVMWAVMMAAMMLPSAIPMIMTHQKIARRKGLRRDNAVFVAAYLVVWGLFSASASALHWGLQELGQLSPMLGLSDNRTASAVLVLVGLSQWMPLKNMCLSKCRTPIGFLVTNWRPGTAGAFKMGLRHGTYCVGCCWALMVLLFVFGAMNLTAIAAVATLVAAEKTLPKGQTIAKVGGVGLILWGVGAFFVGATG